MQVRYATSIKTNHAYFEFVEVLLVQGLAELLGYPLVAGQPVVSVALPRQVEVHKVRVERFPDLQSSKPHNSLKFYKTTKS